MLSEAVGGASPGPGSISRGDGSHGVSACRIASCQSKNGVIISQGDTFREAYHDLLSAIEFHRETFGPDSGIPRRDPIEP